MNSKKWEFDESVTQIFDEMLEKSIPQYPIMRKACFDLACTFIQHGSDFLDLGSSRGESVIDIVRKYGATIRYTLTEVSSPMLTVLKERYKGYEETNIMRILPHDITESLPNVTASVIQAILTIQFTPIECRQQIIQNIYDSLLPGGAFIFVEKVLGSNAQLDTVMVKEYYDLKQENGYTQEEIDRKRLSLRGVLVPVTAKWNEELLYQAGFKKVDCFWRWMNFAAWIAIK